MEPSLDSQGHINASATTQSEKRMMESQAKRRMVSRVSARFRPKGVKLGWEAALFAGLALAALGLRLWELDGRAMHYDESLHVHYAWRLAMGDGYSHSPWMHGPFQIHLTALVFKLFSDTDFTARLAYALFGSALVALPYFLRTYLGRTGAVVTSILLALSPSLLYFSRFGRNEILMAVWAVALLILMWRYLNEGKNRYLYMASAVLALAFATKETSYIVVAIFGAALFLMSLPEIIAWLLGRIKLLEMGGAPIFLILLVTLTLPQWAALTSIFQGYFGVVLASAEGGTGEVGLPALGSPPVSFPFIDLPLAFNVLIIAATLVIPILAILFTRFGRKRARWLLPVAALGGFLYAVIAFPEGSVPRDYLITLGILLTTLVASVMVGVMWRWRVWLLCAGIFYGIWTMLYTSMFGLFVQDHGYCPSDAGNIFGTVCSKFGGVFTGSWQGLGYWLAQQDVARGGQPWYYHLVIGSVYEFLALSFGLAAIIYYLRKGDLFGLLLGFWATLTLIAYTLSGEKMPWLVVNVAVPFILLAGKFIGEMIERVRWRRVLHTAPSALLLLAPLLLLAGIVLLHRYLDQGKIDSLVSWGLLAAIIVMAVGSLFLIRRARPRLGMTLAALGVGALLLGFSSFVAFRASYTYDDSPVEMLVYAQGSADVAEMARTINNSVIDRAEAQKTVEVDYDMWYPFNWYARHEQEEGTISFQCYKNEKEAGYAAHCSALEEPPSTKAILLTESHIPSASRHLQAFERSGPFRNLLWFPEGYRRTGENRKAEGGWWIVPSGKQLKKDFAFAKDNITRREPWKDALDYFLFRRLGNDWWDSKFYAFISPESVP